MNNNQIIVEVDGEQIHDVIEMIKQMDFSEAKFLKFNCTFEEPNEDVKSFSKVVETQTDSEDDKEWEFVQVSKTPEIQECTTHHEVLKFIQDKKEGVSTDEVWEGREWDVKKNTVRATFSRLYHRGCVMREGIQGSRTYRITNPGRQALISANFRESMRKENEQEDSTGLSDLF